MKSAFLMHPLDASYIKRSWYMGAKIWAGVFPDKNIEACSKMIRPFVQKEFYIQNHSAMIIVVPLTARQLTHYPKDFVISRLKGACDLAYSKGARIISLGAYTSICSRQGLDLVGKTKIGLTTGRSYTVYSVMEQVMPFVKKDSIIAVVGADGAIGKTVVRMSKRYTVIKVGKKNIDEMYSADIIISASSSLSIVIDEKKLKRNVIIVDAAKPSDISHTVTRKDIRIINGGVIRVPGDVDFGIDFDLGKNNVYACMAEAFILGMAGQTEDFCVGYDISDEQIQQIGALSKKFGFSVI
jgi:fatty aldehyde-generating acyl-ACP reductase